MAHGEHENLRQRPDVVQRDIASRPNRHHQRASQRVAARLAAVEWRACKLDFDGQSQLVNGLMRTLELIGGRCSKQQKFECETPWDGSRSVANGDPGTARRGLRRCARLTADSASSNGRSAPMRAGPSPRGLRRTAHAPAVPETYRRVTTAGHQGARHWPSGAANGPNPWGSPVVRSPAMRWRRDDVQFKNTAAASGAGQSRPSARSVPATVHNPRNRS